MWCFFCLSILYYDEYMNVGYGANSDGIVIFGLNDMLIFFRYMIKLLNLKRNSVIIVKYLKSYSIKIMQLKYFIIYIPKT